MPVALLVDFGSTYTKAAAIDLDTDKFIGRAQSPSTVQTDVTEGLLAALRVLKQQTGLRDEHFTFRLACSSAAGGLRMVAIGFIGRLTAEAANRAALGAGAKVVAVLERKLNYHTIREMENANPDIVLLAGGVDGGNNEVIVDNARHIAESRVIAPIVVAGNIDVRDAVCAILKRAGRQAVPCANVMPDINRLNVEPARKAIQNIFTQHIVKAKGLDRAMQYVGDIAMPTPLAVLRMAELLATGLDGQAGMGDTVVVDVGGATTDIHSACRGVREDASVPMLGLEEPFAKRTVEGDLGLRVSAPSLIEAAQRTRDTLPQYLVEVLRDKEATARAERLSANPNTLPTTPEEHRMDTAMASMASWIAIGRHAGTQVSDGRTGAAVQYGKDLSQVKALIGTGGVFAFGTDPYSPLNACLFDRLNPFSMRPLRPEMFVDTHYLMYAGGLLAARWPEKAVRLMRRSLGEVHPPARD